MQLTTLLPSDPDQISSSSNRRGLPLSTSLAAAALYREAIELSHGAQAGVTELLDQAIALDPAFAVAQAARWSQAHGESDKEAARVARDAAMTSLYVVSEWERSHVKCVAAMLQSEPDAWTLAREHLAAHPLDLVVAFQLLGDLFFHGGLGKREAVMEVLRSLAPHHEDDWAFLARLGFHMSELGDAVAAIEILDRALLARPQAPFVAHAMGHALLESGRREDSHQFLLDWSKRHELEGPIDGHIQWHLSLGELESGEPAAAVARYLQSSAPGTSHCAAGLVLADAAGLFFRMELAGAPVDGMPRKELYAFLVKLQGALKIPFVAVHAAALTAVLGDDDALRYLGEMDSRMGGDSTDAKTLIVNAFKAHLAGDSQACVDALERDRPSAWEGIGGSNEERALIGSLYASASAALASS